MILNNKIMIPLDFSIDAYEALESLMKVTDSSKKGVIRDAIRFYAKWISLKSEGYKFFIESPDEKESHFVEFLL